MKTLEERVDAMEERLARGDSRMGALEANLKANTSATEEIRAIVVMGKGFFRVLGAIGTMTKWMLTMGAAVGAVYAAWRHGAQP